MVFETLTAGLAAWAARDAEDADAAVAGSSVAIAAAASITVRWMGFIISCSLILAPPPGRSPVLGLRHRPVLRAFGRIDRIIRVTKACFIAARPDLRQRGRYETAYHFQSHSSTSDRKSTRLNSSHP